MKLSDLAASARAVAVVAAFALFVVLFLDWREVSIHAPGVDVDTASSAWAGWGALVAILLLAFLVSVLRGHVVGAHFTGLVAAGLTGVEFFTGSVETDVAGVVSVDTSAELWAAYVGLGLAIVLGAACAVGLAAASGRLAPPPTRLGSGPA